VTLLDKNREESESEVFVMLKQRPVMIYVALLAGLGGMWLAGVSTDRLVPIGLVALMFMMHMGIPVPADTPGTTLRRRSRNPKRSGLLANTANIAGVDGEKGSSQ